MAIVIDFVRRLAPWVYGACALMALWYLRVVILARRERRYAVFKLERETALNRVYSAWLAAIVIIMVMGVTYVLSTTVSDAVQPLITEGQPTPTPTGAALIGAVDITPTLPLPETTPTSTATRRPRPTPRAAADAAASEHADARGGAAALPGSARRDHVTWHQCAGVRHGAHHRYGRA